LEANSVNKVMELVNRLPTLTVHHLSCDDCLEYKSEDYQNCSLPYCVSQFYTVISTHIWGFYEHFLQMWQRVLV